MSRLDPQVREITDELDIPDESIVHIGRGEILVDGSTDLKEVNQLFDTDFPVHEHRTVNGLLLDAFGRVPDRSATLELEGVRIEVLEATETQVQRVRISRLSLDPEAEVEGERRPDSGSGAPAGET